MIKETIMITMMIKMGVNLFNFSLIIHLIYYILFNSIIDLKSYYHSSKVNQYLNFILYHSKEMVKFQLRFLLNLLIIRIINLLFQLMSNFEYYLKKKFNLLNYLQFALTALKVYLKFE